MSPEVLLSIPCRATAHATLSGSRITRLDEKLIGPAVLDTDTRELLSSDGVGWFVGGHPGRETLVTHMVELSQTADGGHWIVLFASRAEVSELQETWPNANPKVTFGPDSQVWMDQGAVFSVPEDLKLVLKSEIVRVVHGIIIYDPFMIIASSRGKAVGGGTFPNDRPQHVVNFQAAIAVKGNCPPIVVCAERPAKSFNTSPIARAYGLDAFQFISGNSLSVRKVSSIDDAK